jgi:hypothetical protein
MKNENNRMEDPLAKRLRNEGEADSPEFSPMLHARIMRRINDLPGSAARDNREWRLQCTIAIAALVALVVTIRFWPAGNVVTPAPVARLTIPAFPDSLAPVATVANPGAQRLDQARYAYLDRDAASLSRYVWNQMDVFPTSR